jgi:hypothetical protein
MNTGEKTIEWLYRDQLKVDGKWSVKSTKGFTWWADKNAQRVEIKGKEIRDGDEAYLISVQTDFLSNVAPAEKTFAALNAFLMPFASMAGPVYDEEAQTVKLCSFVLVHEGIREWMAAMISMACVLQIAEVRIVQTELGEILGAETAESGHPQNGLRPMPDELAEAAANLIAPVGREPCKWTESEFETVVERYMQRPPSLGATGGGLGFTVEFPYGNSTSLFQGMGDQPHPRYGNGLFLLQSFPVVSMSDEDGIRLALSLNATELTEKPFGYGFGSYCFRDSMINFTSFLPNALYRPGLLPSIYFGSGARARQMSIRLLGKDWDDNV